MKDLIEALNIFLKYVDDDNKYPTHCSHDVLYFYGVSPEDVSVEDKQRLHELGFFVTNNFGEEVFASYKYGSC